MWDERFEQVLRPFLPYLPAEEALAPDARLRDFGLDSMATVELMATLEGEYGIRFEDEALSLETFENPAVLWAALTAAGAVVG